MRKILTLIVLQVLFIRVSISQVYQNTTIYTPKGTPVTVWTLISGDYTEQEKLDWKNFFLDLYDNRIIFVSEATYTYNCHAYAWYMTEGGIAIFPSIQNFDVFWSDGSYTLSSPSVGTKILYVDGDHSAIATNDPSMVESKWASGPVFRHAIEDCPYYGYATHIDYYIKDCDTYYMNKTVAVDTTIFGCNNTYIQDVNIINNAKLKVIIGTGTAVRVEGAFKVQLGSELKVK